MPKYAANGISIQRPNQHEVLFALSFTLSGGRDMSIHIQNAPTAFSEKIQFYEEEEYCES